MDIKNKNIEDFYPLSPLQQGILFHSLADSESGVYFEQSSLNLKGTLNVKAFHLAWQKVIKRHSVLRTSFVWEDLKEPVQIVHKQVNLPWQEYNWQHLSPKEQQQKLQSFLQSDRAMGFELKQVPLMRLTLIHLANNFYNFTWSHHHLLLDGWSFFTVFQEVIACYKAFSNEGEISLEPVNPFRDYIVWLQQQDLSQAETFWRQTLKGFTSPTQLSINKKASLLTQKDEYNEQELNLSQATTAALQSLAKQHQLTLNIIVQGAWALLLNRYSGQEDVVFGAVTSGRPPTLAGVESMVGLFINTVPIRVKVSPDELLLPWLHKIKDFLLEARQYEYCPLVKVQEWSEIAKGFSLFESLVVFENYAKDTSILQKNNVDFEIELFHNFEKTNYPLTLTVIPGEELSLNITSINSDRFDNGTITRMLGHLQTLLEGMVTNQQQHLSNFSLLTESERQQLLVEWNQTQRDYLKDKCIHQLFEEQVEKTPDAVALVFEDQQLTYIELNARANQLAHYLRSLGVKPEVLVGICVERSLSMVVGLLGILKAGGAYVPLDPDYPQERLAYMLKDAQIPILLTQQPLLAQLPEHQAQVVCLDTDWTVIAPKSQENPVNQTQAENLAYVIYTSGSTGTPKGVMIQHNSLVNYTEAVGLEYELEPSDRILQFASLSFDVAAEEIFPCLVKGATLVLRTERMLSSIANFWQTSRNLGLTVLNLPTAFWHQLTVELSANLPLPEAVRLVIIGGEKALVKHWQTWQQQVDRQVRLINCYGPTEATIGATMFDLSRLGATELVGRQLPIGKPLPNIQVYVLDAYLQPVAVGIPGELYIGGVGVARGYLHRPELTQEKFIPNPIAPSLSKRLYQTGDLARYLSDGNIEYLGRIDHQVQIRGFRIELGEIEAVLSTYPQIQQAVVIAWEDIPGNQSLVAYIVTEKQQSVSTGELRHFLKQKLPEYMVPNIFVTLDALPLTPNGKVDKKSLPVPNNRAQLEEAYVMPKTEAERIIATVWQDLLQLEKVGIDDNFFTIGGNSLLSISVHGKLNKIFGQELSIIELFKYPTIKELAQYLTHKTDVEKAEENSSIGVYDRANRQKKFIKRREQILRQQGRKING
jgi:amino acid adenylation domain-containing protein